MSVSQVSGGLLLFFLHDIHRMRRAVVKSFGKFAEKVTPCSKPTWITAQRVVAAASSVTAFLIRKEASFLRLRHPSQSSLTGNWCFSVESWTSCLSCLKHPDKRHLSLNHRTKWSRPFVSCRADLNVNEIKVSKGGVAKCWGETGVRNVRVFICDWKSCWCQKIVTIYEN